MVTRFLVTTFAAALLCGVLPTPARAHHQQTPPLVQLTRTGDDGLPRVWSLGDAIPAALPTGTHGQIVLWHTLFVARPRQQAARSSYTTIDGVGHDANPAGAFFGYGQKLTRGVRVPAIVVWDSDAAIAGAEGGRQVWAWARNAVAELSHDPTGTSVDPAIGGAGTLVAFESRGDLAATGNHTAQIFTVKLPPLRLGLIDDGLGANADRTPSPAARRSGRSTGVIGAPVQLSHGAGESHHAGIDEAGHWAVWDSTSDPATGADTGVSHVVVADLQAGRQLAIGVGQGPSWRPSISSDGRFVAFESRSDLAGSGADTGTPQVYLYDLVSKSYARVTNDPAGCGLAAVNASEAEWHVTFVCHGQGYVYRPAADEIGRVPALGADTAAMLPESGRHFVVVATNAECHDCGTATARFDPPTGADHHLFLWNLFKLPPVPTGLTAQWFPSRPNLR